jgi:hypothetical protein
MRRLKVDVWLIDTATENISSDGLHDRRRVSCGSQSGQDDLGDIVWHVFQVVDELF